MNEIHYQIPKSDLSATDTSVVKEEQNLGFSNEKLRSSKAAATFLLEAAEFEHLDSSITVARIVERIPTKPVSLYNRVVIMSDGVVNFSGKDSDFSWF